MEEELVSPADNELLLESSPAAMRLGVDALTCLASAAAAAAAAAAFAAFSALALAFAPFSASV